MFKFLFRSIVFLVILLAVVVVGGLFFINGIVKAGIEGGGTHALKVETTLDSADISLLNGQFSLSGLEVNNPEGYETQKFLSLGEGSVAISVESLLEETVEIPLLELKNLELTLDQKGGTTNINEILGGFGGQGGGEEVPAEEPSSGDASEGKKFHVGKVTISGVKLLVAAPPLGTPAKPSIVEVPEIVIEDVGSDSTDGLTMSQLIVDIVVKTVDQVVVSSGDQLPSVLAGEIDAAVKRIGSVDRVARELKESGEDVSDSVKKSLNRFLKGGGEGK